MPKDTRELALASAFQAYSLGAIDKDSILATAAEYETYLDGPTSSDQKDSGPSTAGDWSRGWDAALDSVRERVFKEDSWPWRDRIADMIEELKK